MGLQFDYNALSRCAGRSLLCTAAVSVCVVKFAQMHCIQTYTNVMRFSLSKPAIFLRLTSFWNLTMLEHAVIGGKKYWNRFFCVGFRAIKLAVRENSFVWILNSASQFSVLLLHYICLIGIINQFFTINIIDVWMKLKFVLSEYRLHIIMGGKKKSNIIHFT